jgi:hypothetical protein
VQVQTQTQKECVKARSAAGKLEMALDVDPLIPSAVPPFRLSHPFNR